MKKFQNGDKVIVKTKSVGSTDSNCVKYAEEKGQDFLFVKCYKKYDGQEVVCCDDEHLKPSQVGGDYFLESDLEFYKVEYKKGDKVVPHKKSCLGDLASSVEWRKAREFGQPFLYVSGIAGDNTLILSCNEGYGGDYFKESDVSMYENNSKLVEMLQKENKELQERLDDQIKRKKRALDERDAVDEENEALVKQIEEQRNQFNQLRNKFDKVSNELESLTEEHSVVESKNEVLTREKLMLQRRVETLMKVIEKLV